MQNCLGWAADQGAYDSGQFMVYCLSIELRVTPFNPKAGRSLKTRDGHDSYGGTFGRLWAGIVRI